MSRRSLAWRSIVNGPKHAHRVAEGRYPDETYHLKRIETTTSPYWEARFVVDGKRGTYDQVLERGNFIQARKSCINHHNHPGV